MYVIYITIEQCMLTLCKITDISVRVGKLFLKIVVNTLLDIVLYVQTVFVTYCIIEKLY
jgi:hypothetical protein